MLLVLYNIIHACNIVEIQNSFWMPESLNFGKMACLNRENRIRLNDIDDIN